MAVATNHPDEAMIAEFLNDSAEKFLDFIFRKADEAIATGQEESDEYAQAVVDQFKAGLRAVFDAGHDYAVHAHSHGVKDDGVDRRPYPDPE